MAEQDPNEVGFGEGSGLEAANLGGGFLGTAVLMRNGVLQGSIISRQTMFSPVDVKGINELI